MEDSECVLIGANACKGMEELHTIHFPPSVQYFGASAFSETRTLAMSNLPSGLKEIEQSAFYRGRTESGGDMTKITISELPNSLEYLGS